MPKGKIILLVIDGFGIGKMPDATEDCNTAQSVYESANPSKIATLLEIGFFFEQKKAINQNATASKLGLDYPGADSLLGHLCMAGIDVSSVNFEPLSKARDEVKKELEKNGFKVLDYLTENKNTLLIVDDGAVIADNFDADYGIAINVSGCLDVLSFDKVIKIGRIVRSIVRNSRVIAFGANNVKLSDLLENVVEYKEYAGIRTPRTGMYNASFRVQHFPMQLDMSRSVFAQLKNENGIETAFLGKFTDFFDPGGGRGLSDTGQIGKLLLNEVKEGTKQVIAANIQGTDLAGHSQDVMKYVEEIYKVDEIVSSLLKLIKANDVLLLTADHGNDPKIEHKGHTREYVPLVVINAIESGKVLSDIAKIIRKLAV